MGGKSSKVSPKRVVPDEREEHRRQHSDLNSQTSNSQTLGGSLSTNYGRQDSGHSSSHMTRGGGHSRPDSQRSKRPMSQMSRYSGKVGLNQGQSRTGSRSYGRPDGRLKDSFQPTRVDPFTPSDLATSYRSNFASRATKRQQSIPDLQPCEQSSLGNNESTSYLMKINTNEDEPQGPVTACPTCASKYSRIVHVPYLMLCGHSFCSSCIERALKYDPPSLKCGLCFIKTPIEPQCEVEDFVKNEAILDLIESKEFATTIGSFQNDRCAECERNIAVKYCSECSASYCETCSKQQHTGSKVRARHKPIPISLKPKPQPTCKKHPGQSCVLYCETEHQPMCVLCKFYGQHKFHSYQLLNNSASAYRNALTLKLAEISKVEERLSLVAQTQSSLKDDIRNKAMEAQAKLEKHFAETRKEAMAALEHCEAALLCLLDRQVEIQETILEEQRLELASARSRAIVAKEEVTKLLDLNPISALLARKHVDNALDCTLKQTSLFPDVVDESNNTQLLPLGLRPKQEITSKLQQVLEQHGTILQLPERPILLEARVHSKSISIKWEISDENLKVTNDRTQAFSLHCFADVPLKFKREKLQNFHNRRLLSVNSNSPGPSSHDSGYQDCSSADTMSQVSDGRLPLLPASMRTSSNHNVSLITMQQQLPDNGIKPESQGLFLEEVSNPSTPVKKPSVLKPQSVKLAQSTPAARASGALLKLPALLTKTTEDELESPSDSENDDAQLMSNASEALSGGTQDASHLLAPGNTITQTQATSSQTSSCSSSNSNISHCDEPNDNNGVSIGQCSKGYKFEEIYAGPNTNFTYSGIVGGATYYFRVRCCNAVGAGPWSDTFKCKIPSRV